MRYNTDLIKGPNHTETLYHMWVQTIREATAGTILFVLMLFCTAKAALNASAKFDPGACEGYKGLLPTIILWSKPRLHMIG